MSWFKNITVYKLNNTDSIKYEELAQTLEENKFIPCGETDLKSEGWVKYSSHLGEFCPIVANCLFFKLRIEKKNIPSSVVKERLAERVAAYESESGEKPNKSLKNDFKDAIIMDLATKAFCSSSFIDAYIDIKNELIFVNTASAKQAELLLGALRQELGSLDVSPLEPKNNVSSILSTWISSHSVPPIFEIGVNGELKDPSGDQGSIVVKKLDFETEEMLTHIRNGKIVEKIELVWQKRIRFILNSKFEIKSIKMEEIVTSQLEEELGEDDSKATELYGSLNIMTGDFAELIDDLLKNL